MVQTTEEARQLLTAVFDDWNKRDVGSMLQYFCDDLVFVEHAGDDADKYKVRHGRRAFGDYLQSYLDVADCHSQINLLTWDGIYIRTFIDFTVTLHANGRELEGKFRQVIRLRDGRISHLDEYHDVAGARAFWGL